MASFYNNAINSPNLPIKATPVGADWVIISNSASTPVGEPMRATLTSIISATGVTFAQTEVDFGSSPVYDAYFTVTDSGVTTGSFILVSRDGKAATGQDADENELANFEMTATAGTGDFSLYMQCTDGYVAGKYVINYSY